MVITNKNQCKGSIHEHYHMDKTPFYSQFLKGENNEHH